MQLRAMTVFAVFLTSIWVQSGLVLSQGASVPAPTGGLESPIGKVVTVDGSATVEHTVAIVTQVSAPSGTVHMKIDDLVYRGDVIRTGANSKVSLTFADGTAFNISSNARMELNEFVYSPTGQSNSSMFNLVEGSFTFVAGKIATSGSMKIDTPAATMGIRGTTPHVVISKDGTVKFSTLVEENR